LKHPLAAEKSNYEIAEHCGVAESYIRKVKGDDPIYAQNADGTRTVSRQGKTFTMKTAKSLYQMTTAKTGAISFVSVNMFTLDS